MPRRTRHPAAIEQHPIVDAYTAMEAAVREAQRSAGPTRTGRSTVPYTEPGPTMHENFAELQREAMEAYSIIERAAAFVAAEWWHGRESADILDSNDPSAVLYRALRGHLKTYEERHRRGGE